MNELISSLVSQLGITEGQAKGGAGALFRLAQEKLSGAQFGELNSVLGGRLADLIQLAPQAEPTTSSGGVLGKLAGMIGGDKGSSLGSLSNSFSQLGMGAGVVTKFMPVIMKYLEEKGGASIRKMISDLV